MSSLLSLLLVTQSEHSSPALTFAWPPQPRPIPRLDRPVYKPSQSRPGGADPLSFTETKSRSRSYLPKEDRSVLHYVRGFKKDGGSSEEEELDMIYQPTSESAPPRTSTARVASGGSLAGSYVRRRTVQITSEDQDEDSNPFPGSFYWANANRRELQDRVSSDSDHLTQYLGFEPDDWADMLTSKLLGSIHQPGLRPTGSSGRKLEFVIDSLAIIGHPSIISQKISTSHLDLSFERGRTRTRSGDQDLSGGNSSTGHDSIPPLDLSSFSPRQPRTESANRKTKLSNALHTSSPSSTTPGSGRTLMGESKTNTNPRTSEAVSPPLSASSPCSSRPSAGPVSQLTRMMTPSITSQLDSPIVPPSLLNLASSSSIRSTSSPSPRPVGRKRDHLGVDLNSTRFVSTYSPLDLTRSNDILPTPDSTADLTSTSTRLVPLQSFTLALIVDTPPASHLSQHLDVYYQDVVLKLTAALKRLERQSAYLTRESQKIRRFELDHRESDSHRSSSRGRKTSTQDMMRLI